MWFQSDNAPIFSARSVSARWCTRVRFRARIAARGIVPLCINAWKRFARKRSARYCWHRCAINVIQIENIMNSKNKIVVISSPGVAIVTWDSKPEVRRVVRRLNEVMKCAAVEILSYKHANVSSALFPRMRRTKFTGVARWTRCDVTRRDSPRRRTVVERALKPSSRNDVDVTWHRVDL